MPNKKREKNRPSLSYAEMQSESKENTRRINAPKEKGVQEAGKYVGRKTTRQKREHHPAEATHTLNQPAEMRYQIDVLGSPYLDPPS